LQVVEDLSLEQKKVQIDVALSKSCLHVDEEVCEACFQHVWDEGFGGLPFAGDVELGIVIGLLFRMRKECLKVGVPLNTVSDMGTNARGLGRSWAER
jgi:hypothetical protein